MKKFAKLLAVLVVFFASGCGAGGDAQSMDAPADSAEGTVAPKPEPGDNEVLAVLPQFNPTLLEVSVGTEVTFTNPDVVRHTATGGTRDAPTPEDFDLKLDARGGTGTHTFNSAGTFSFFCDIHPNMAGSVTVT